MNHALVRRTVASRCAFALLLCLLASAEADGPLGQLVALADTARLKNLTVEELLQQDVLSVSRRPEPWAEAPSNVFLITRQASQGINATGLPDLLRLAPNLFVAQSNSYHWAVEARGFTRTNAHSNKLLVLVDGRTAYSPLYSNVFWYASDVFLPDLDTIEVISGPSGANWGANAVNGVINITSKSARETLGGLARVTVGNDGNEVAWRQGFALGRTGAMRVFLKRTQHDATLGPTGADDEYDAWQRLQGGFRADWGDPDTGALTIQGDGVIGRFDTNPAPPAREHDGNVIVKYLRNMGAGDTFWVRGYYDFVRRDVSGGLLDTTHTMDLEFQRSRPLTERQALLWGANFRRIYDEADDPVGFAILPAHRWLDVGSLFAQHELSFTDDRLRLTTGMRLEHNDFSGWEFQPTARLAWHRPGQTVWVSASRATRIPSRLETGFYVPSQPPYFIAGGPDFTAETLNAYELGWRGQPARGTALTATIYYHDYDQLRTVELSSPIVQANGAAGRSYGTELFIDRQVTPYWRLRAGGFLTWQDTWVKSGHTDAQQSLGESSFPRFQGSLRNSFRLSPNVDLWTSLRTTDRVPASEDGGGRIPAYTELDANLNWRVGEHWEFSLSGRSLLHRSHLEIGGRNLRREIPRQVFATVKIEY